MDDTLKEPLETSNPKTPHSFLCCFGRTVAEEKFMKVVEPEGKRKKRWFSWSRFRIKNSSTKTVPVDSGPLHVKTKSSSTDHHKTNASKAKVKRKSDEKAITTKHDQIPVNNQKATHQVPARVGLDQTSKDRHQETRSGSEQNIILENGKSTSQRRLSFRRKIDAIRTGSSLPGSPEPKTKFTRTVSVTRAASFPTPLQGRRTSTEPVNSRVTVRKANKENDATGNQLDSLVGLTVLVVTLIILVFWGRVCAILCTSAWFYFIPRLRTGTGHDIGKNGGVTGEPDFNSDEYKKKVVLEGFLERTHRSKP